MRIIRRLTAVTWTEDEKYEICKRKNKRLKKLTQHRYNKARPCGQVCDSLNNSAFASTEELNQVFETDMQNCEKLGNILESHPASFYYTYSNIVIQHCISALYFSIVLLHRIPALYSNILQHPRFLCLTT